MRTFLALGMRVAERHRLRMATTVGARCDGHLLCPSSSDHSRDRVGGGVIAFFVGQWHSDRPFDECLMNMTGSRL